MVRSYKGWGTRARNGRKHHPCVLGVGVGVKAR